MHADEGEPQDADELVQVEAERSRDERPRGLRAPDEPEDHGQGEQSEDDESRGAADEPGSLARVARAPVDWTAGVSGGCDQVEAGLSAEGTRRFPMTAPASTTPANAVPESSPNRISIRTLRFG